MSGLIRFRLRSAPGFSALLYAFYAAPVVAQNYHITSLGVLPGGTYSVATGINDQGEIVGYGDSRDGSVRAWRYRRGTLIDLGSLGAPSLIYAYGINSEGEITGYSFTATGNAHAFRYHDGKMHDLGTLGGTDSGGYATNNRGEITGVANTPGDASAVAFLYSGGTMRSLGTLGGSTSMGQGINREGAITGWSFTAGDLAQHAFWYRHGAMYDLGTLGGPGQSTLNSQGFAINEAGQIVGFSDIASGSTHAFLYTNASMHDLGTLGGFNSMALDINRAGDIVGSSLTPTEEVSHAFIYRRGKMIDLNSVIDPASPLFRNVILTFGAAINRSGQIAANGFDTRGTAGGAYLLTRPDCLEEQSRKDDEDECRKTDGRGAACEDHCGHLEPAAATDRFENLH